MKFYLERIEIVGRKFETFRIDSKFVNFSKSLDIEKKTIFPNFSNRENSRKEEKRGGGENENHGAETDFACYARRDKGCGQTWRVHHSKLEPCRRIIIDVPLIRSNRR